jgi:capsular polysaccharide biosynthesis protein
MYFLAAFVLVAVFPGLWMFRQASLAKHPETWRADLDMNTEAALVRRYLKRNGWTLLPAHPAARLLVRAQKKNAVWLNLLIQNRTTLSLRTTILDLLGHSHDNTAMIGILTREPITEEHLELVSRGRVFLITHTQLADAEEITKQTARRVQRETEQAKAEPTQPMAARPAAAVPPAALPAVQPRFQEGPVRLHHQPFSPAEMIQSQEAWQQPPPALIVQTSDANPIAWSPLATAYRKHAIYSIDRHDVLLFGPNHLADGDGNWSLEAEGFPGQYIDFYNSKPFQHIFSGPKPHLLRIGDGREVELDASRLHRNDYLIVDNPVFLATSVEPDNWGRWLSTVIPKAIHFRRTEAGSDRSFFCCCNKTWQTVLLRSLGIEDHRLLFHDPGRTYVCRDLRTLTYSAADLTPTAFEQEIYRGLRQSFGQRVDTGQKRIFVSRANRTLQAPGYRRLVNEEALIATLTALGFAVVEPELLAFEEQVATFSNADVVVGLGGAGMYNVLFCQPGTKVITIESSAYFIPGYSRLFAATGLHYGVIFGEQDATDPAPIHKRWRIDERKAADAIATFL